MVSQQLSVLRANQIVVGRKTGASVRYTVRDPLVGDLLDVARQIFNNQLAGTQSLLRQLRRERPERAPSRCEGKHRRARAYVRLMRTGSPTGRPRSSTSAATG